MNPQAVAFVLKLFQQSWQGLFKVETYTAHVWAEACDGIDDEDALAAARRLVRSQDRPPSIARFREECSLVRRNNAPALSAGPIVPSVGRERSARFAGALARGLKAANEMIPDHDHHEDKPTGKRAGWVDCPACSTINLRHEQVTTAIRDELQEFMS